MVVMSFYLGPYVDRWSPASWQDVVSAAASGTLDEKIWVELKAAVPPHSDTANLESAKDMASLAVEGGLLLIGIRDNDSNAGEVVGTELAGLGHRLEQVARDRIHPPLVIRHFDLADPARPEWGCLLVVVDASQTAPHMVDDSYWGRTAKGKRRLPDVDVRQILDRNARTRAKFREQLDGFVDSRPLKVDGCIYLVAHPRNGRPELFDVDDRQAISQLILGADRKPANAQYSWWWTEPPEIHPVVDGVELRFFDPAALDEIGRSPRGVTMHFGALDDSGTISVCVNDMVSWEGTTFPQLHIEGVEQITAATVALAGAVADTCGYAGTWDFGVVVSDTAGARAARAERGSVRYARRAFPDDRYVRTTQTTSAELCDASSAVTDRLLVPLRRVAGS